MSPDLDTRDLTDDAVLGGRLSILQPRVGHRVGHDAILLAAATAATAGDHAVDLGAGVGAAGLALATRVDGVSVTLVDIDSNLIALARENAARNRLANRVSAVTLDVAAPRSSLGDLASGLADHVLMNPPFNDPSRQHVSPDARRRMAHCSSQEMLASWIRTAGRILRPSGTVTLIFRADGIGEVLQALGTGFGAIAVRPIYAKPAASAIRILARAVKSSRAPTSVRPGFLLNGADGRPTAEAEAVLRGAAALPFDAVE
jgi:tRNA1(Val) A37 N6-methylase TrmN6